jgi:hypothetical protein
MPAKPSDPPYGIDAGLHEKVAGEIDELKSRLVEIEARRRARAAAKEADAEADEPPGIPE